MTLGEVATQIRNCDKKVQLIYAFNGSGKTRLSRELRTLISPDIEGDSDANSFSLSNRNFLYYNAFTEDLFYWDNDLESDTTRKLIIQPNYFTKWIFEEQGQESNIINNFQHYSNNDKLIPKFNADFTEVSFSIRQDDENVFENIKISKGEESNFIWCIFYSMFEQIISTLNDSVNAEAQEEDVGNPFENLEYILIDDPVTSLDDNHLIQLAVDLANLITLVDETINLKFIITTHNPLFYNVLFNEFNSKKCYMLNKNEDDTYELEVKNGDSYNGLSYHLHIKNILERAIENNTVEKFHFTLLRNLYEKTASFLGFRQWANLLPDNQELYYKRIMNFSSHSTLTAEVISEPTQQEKQTVKLLLNHLIDDYGFWKEQSND